jgi:hypothetical protein
LLLPLFTNKITKIILKVALYTSNPKAFLLLYVLLCLAMYTWILNNRLTNSISYLGIMDMGLSWNVPILVIGV